MGVEVRTVGTLARASGAELPVSFPREPIQPHAFYGISKRLTDVVAASGLLILTVPIILLAMAAICLTTRSNPLLSQRRIGRHGEPFTMFKLRTMRDGERKQGGFVAKSSDDPRVTAVGRFIRRTSIDELPQLLNVQLGQMSLVGPRPALPEEVAEYRPGWRRRLEVMPGLTGLWQVSGRSSLSVERWMALDRCYVRRRSLALDLAILARTVAAVVTMRGAW